MTENEELTPSELKKKAYLIALRLKNTELDQEAIYARLEKQGIPEEMAREVIIDVMIETTNSIKENNEPIYHFALSRVAIGLGLGVITYFATGNAIIPAGLIIGGIVTALLAKKRMDGGS